MATRGKKTRKKAVAKKKRGPAKKSRSASAKKSSASSRRAKRPVKRSAAKKTATAKKSAAPKKAAPPKKAAAPANDGGSPMSRVKRVAQEVAHQATTAVSEGAHALKELGENIVERVTG